MHTPRLYGMSGSGNCWKPAVLMQHLDMPFEWVEVDIVNGASRTPAFLSMNPNGKVPLLEVEGRYLAESNAMLCYLADGTPWLPQDRWARARVMEWLFFEQYSHEPHIATVRYWIRFLGKAEAWADRIAAARDKGNAALAVMEQQLTRTDWLAGDTPTIADLGLAAYTHVADEGGYDLARYPAVSAWLQRLFALPRITPMSALSVRR
jgi:glutathione S-transferase